MPAYFSVFRESFAVLSWISHSVEDLAKVGDVKAIGLLRSSGLEQDHPLTAPAVRPETMARWKIRTRMINGTVTITDAAMMLPQGSS